MAMPAGMMQQGAGAIANANPYAAAINAAAGVGTAALKTGGKAFSAELGNGDAISGAPVNLGGRTYVNGNGNNVIPNNSQAHAIKTPEPQTGYADGYAPAAGSASKSSEIPPLIIAGAAALLLIVLFKMRKRKG